MAVKTRPHSVQITLLVSYLRIASGDDHDAVTPNRHALRSRRPGDRKSTLLGAPEPAAEEKPEPATVLRVQRRSIEVNGKAASVLGIRQPDGAPGLVTSVPAALAALDADQHALAVDIADLERCDFSDPEACA